MLHPPPAPPPASPAHQAKAPDHPSTASVREDALTTRAKEFYAAPGLRTERAELLAEQFPANAAQEAARREAEGEGLRQWRRQVDSADDAHIREAAGLAPVSRGCSSDPD